MKFWQTTLNLGKKLIQKVSIFTLLICVVSVCWTTSSGPQGSPKNFYEEFVFGAHRSSSKSSAQGPTSVAGMSIDEVSAILAERMHAAPKDQVSELSKHLLSLCQKFRFDPAFILSVIQTESGFQSEALSPAGAVGLMQLMPATAQVVVRDMNPPLERPVAGMNQQLLMDPFINLTLGVTYLASLRDRYKTLHPYVVLAAYNLGPARIDELLSKKAFKPDKTKKYFEAIRQGTSQFRLYRAYRRPA